VETDLANTGPDFKSERLKAGIASVRTGASRKSR